MALFQNKPQTSDPTNYFTVGQNKTILLVGLGNPGAEYDLTRHNVGFFVIDQFVNKSSEMENWIIKKDLKCALSGGRIGENRILAMKPLTFMNLSGEAVRKVVDFYKIPLPSVLVFHDELDIDFGQIRMRIGGSSAGHNGIKSVSQHITDEFGRVRIGIGPKNPNQIKSEDFVLQKFNETELGQLPNLAQEVNAIITEYIYGGELPHETRNFIV